MCKVSASRLNRTDIGEIKFLKDGSKINGTKYVDFVWRPEGSKTPKNNFERFGLRFFEVDHAASYQVDCKLRVCDHDSSDAKLVDVSKIIRHPCQVDFRGRFGGGGIQKKK